MKKSADPSRLDAALGSIFHAPLFRRLLVLASISLLGGCELLGASGGEAGESKSASQAAQDTETSEGGGGPMTDDRLRELWLRRVQTRPADFLAARFERQLELRAEEAEGAEDAGQGAGDGEAAP